MTRSADDRGEEAGTVQRDNGLEADTFVFLGSVDAERSDELLDDLAAEGIAAYAVSGEPAEEVYVDQGSVGYARALLRRSGAAVDATADADDTADDATDADDESGETDEDTAWQRIVADYDRTDDGDDKPWPDAENIDDDTGDKDGKGGKGDEDEDDEPRTVGKNKARVSIVELDIEDDDEPEDTEDHFDKPEPPALPKGDVWTKGAWVLMLAALAYPIAGLILDWDMPGWSIALAVVVFIAGVVIHVVRMRNPHDGADSDDGAVV